MPTNISKNSQEKREKRWRSKCPIPVKERIRRANKEDMKILKQGSVKKLQCKFRVAGSTGNVYTTTIGKVPSCTCPDYQKKQDACKHTLFVLLKIVGLDAVDDELLYQKAFVSAELEELFERMEENKESASRYFQQNDDTDVDGLIRDLAVTNIEEDGRGPFRYDNVRSLTGQPSERDRSTYRPFHWETSNKRYY
ncbi:RING finger domain protein (Znf1) [Seminavis robusta]|uniref:RING finger domain protein (Znf1) n=1 Tax=Seminavis robusta TaxID=568900 RepID=A0A9N8F4Z0_9STRA|nr:RING finger domain protein (Znf1) [Seminavis robusta]CAB9530810.1 RING finger domain protein (Znf1) [Seminavis robusta]|eukprot:Sro3058_g342910.1 RING finger domain protein (Znf1) (195) ;mRNA; r:8545-9129